MSSFLTEDFLLDTDFSRQLYHDFAAEQPIFDFHCHLPPQLIAENYQFKNLYDIWLKGDHYKWRAMRSNGADERFCTGDADDYAKYQAYAATVPHTIGNPLYHWTHLELRRPFGLSNVVLSPATEKQVWDFCNDKLAQPEFSARGIMQQMNVKLVATTDDPIDDLQRRFPRATLQQVCKPLRLPPRKLPQLPPISRRAVQQKPTGVRSTGPMEASFPAVRIPFRRCCRRRGHVAHDRRPARGAREYALQADRGLHRHQHLLDRPVRRGRARVRHQAADPAD